MAQAQTRYPADIKVLTEELKPTLDALERGRIKSLQNISTGWRKISICILIVVAVSILILVISSSLSSPHPPESMLPHGSVRHHSSSHNGSGSGSGLGFLVIPLVIAGGIYCIYTHSKHISGHQAVYTDYYKRKVIAGMTRLIQPDMVYSPERGISEQTFKETGLYTSSVDRYHSEDLFAGKIGKTAMMFSETHAEERRRRTDSKGRSSTYWVTVFKGLLTIVDFNKDFKSWLVIKPDFAEKSFGWFGRVVQNFSSNLIRLESPEFEEAFVVHGGDQVEARYILTPDLQERLLDLRKWFGDDIRMAFHDSRLHLSIPNSDNWFEPNIKIPANDTSQIHQFLRQMSSIFRIVELLDLNTRIWTKD